MTKKGGSLSFKLIWAILMVVIYFLVAYLLVFSPLFKENSTIPEAIRIAIAVVFCVYGIFRGYRLLKK